MWKWQIMWNMAKGALQSLIHIRAFRWLSPRDTKEAAECAIGEVDVDLAPGMMNYLGAFLGVLQKMDPRVNNDHPIFQYIGKTAYHAQNPQLTVTISIKRREAKAVRR